MSPRGVITLEGDTCWAAAGRLIDEAIPSAKKDRQALARWQAAPI
jgi:hypothetical protein